MAENLNKAMQSAVAVAMLLLPCFLPGWAVAVQDPTRPAYGPGSYARDDTHRYQSNTRGLKSVVISSRRCAAIIDGKTVLLGAQFGRERLVEIMADRVVLQGAAGTRVMYLYPAVELRIKQEKDRKAQQPECRIGAGQRDVHDADRVKEVE